MNRSLVRSLGLMVCALLMPVMAFAQNITVNGSVVGSDNEPIPGAYVAVANSSNGTVTDLDGKFSLSVASNATLEVSFMGYVTETVAVNGRTTLAIVLHEDSEALEATVVIGYGTAKKSDITGSISSVGGNDLREIPANDISRALEGRVAGVQMTQTNTKPGSSMQIRIRGQRSLSASNDPLIVLDGIPFMGNLSDISPNDIKSMDILKDAASTAIYGSRGANGVIMITTYKGVEGSDARISFNSYVTMKKAIKYPMMQGEKYIKLRKMAGSFSNSIFESDDVDTDWQDLFYRTGLTQNYELSVSGGTKSGSYRFGTTYYKDQAVIPTQAYDRISLNGSVDQKIGKWFKIGFSTNTNYNTNQGNQVDLYAVLSKSPLVNPYDANGDLLWRVDMPQDANQYIFTRERVEELTAKGVYNNESRSLGTYNTGYLQFNFPWIEGLNYKVSVGLNYRNSRGGSFTGSGVNAQEGSQNGASWSFSETQNWTVENLLTYDRTFGKHHINAVALYSAEQTTSQGQSLNGKNIPNELFQWYTIGECLASDITVGKGSYSQSGLLSYMGRAMYTYADKYMLSAAVRSDASSRLAPGHQWHTYPAVSAGWNIHKESFMAGTKGWLDELKVRVGFGETSNQSISPYATLGGLGTSVYNFADELYSTGYRVTTLPNDDLGWEYSMTWNYGLDYSFFQGRLRGSVEYYRVSTKDILLSLGLPSTAGVGSTTANIGATQNRGLEFTVNGTIIDNDDWNWTAGLNFYANRNKLVALADGTKENTGAGWFVGMPLNCIYDYVYDGLWQVPANELEEKIMDKLEPSKFNDKTGFKDAIGTVKVKYFGEYDENGVPTRAIGEADKQARSSEPIFAGGFNTTLRWKNLDFSVIGAFQAGGILLSSLHTSESYLNMNSGRRGQLDVDYWTPENTNARYPRPGSVNSSDNPKYASLLGQFNGSYFKIRTITLGYNLGRVSALKQAGISNCRVYATLQNPGLVLFSDFHKETGLDPETNSSSGNTATGGRPGPGGLSYVGFNTPQTRNFLFGVNLTF